MSQAYGVCFAAADVLSAAAFVFFIVKGKKMTEEHKNCRYRFWKWLIEQALNHKRVYWLLWGALIALRIAGHGIGELL